MGISLRGAINAATRAYQSVFIIGTSGARPIGSHQQGTSLSSVVTLTPPTDARVLTIQPFTQNIRMTFEGTDPTSSKGIRLVATGLYEITLTDEMTLKVIEEAASASIEYWWGR